MKRSLFLLAAACSTAWSQAMPVPAPAETNRFDRLFAEGMAFAASGEVALFWAASLVACPRFARGADGDGPSVESAYAAWTNHLAREVFPASATNLFLAVSDVYGNEPFQRILDKGVEALPFLAEKMPENGLLAEAFSRIAKFRYAVRRTGETPGKRAWYVEGHPDARSATGPPNEVAVFVAWWRIWRFDTPALFEAWDSEYRSAQARNDFPAATNALRKIRDLGIPVLPCLVDAMERTPAYLPLVSELTGRPFPGPEGPGQAKRWWEENKRSFSLPSAEESRPGGIPPF